MTNFIPPPWLEGPAQHAHDVLPAEKPGRWVKGMPSPNKAGRPKGIVDKRTKVTQVLMDDAPAIARVVIDAALEGDLHACSLVLGRIAPALRPQGERVTFDFDPTASISGQVEQVIKAIAQGAVAPEVGKQLIDSISALSAVRATEELEARLGALESKEFR